MEGMSWQHLLEQMYSSHLLIKPKLPAASGDVIEMANVLVKMPILEFVSVLRDWSTTAVLLQKIMKMRPGKAAL